MITTLFRTPVRLSISESLDGLSVSTRRPAAGAVRRKDQKQNVALTTHLFCLRLQCCCKRRPSRCRPSWCCILRPQGRHRSDSPRFALQRWPHAEKRFDRRTDRRTPRLSCVGSLPHALRQPSASERKRALSPLTKDSIVTTHLHSNNVQGTQGEPARDAGELGRAW